MPDILLFGATGYTGRLVAQALSRRGASFAIAGRGPAKLDALARQVAAEDARVARVGEIDELARAAQGVRVLVTCVGPFTELGDTAVQAALKAKVHYVDSTGEGGFIRRLRERYDQEARRAGIMLAPAMAFDEIPADVAATLATEGLERPRLTLTYAVPSTPSRGTLLSILHVLPQRARFIEDGAVVEVEPGGRRRWSPMPPPLGPKLAAAAPMAELELAPLHLDLRALETYVTAGRARANAMRVTLPAARILRDLAPVRSLLGGLTAGISGPDQQARNKRWTIVAEARAGDDWRNVVVQGRDVYGLSGELLAVAAIAIARDGERPAGVVAPVQAVALDELHKGLIDHGVEIDTYGPQPSGTPAKG